MTIKVNVVSSDRLVFDGEVGMVVVPSVDGEIGILENHQPLMTILREGIIKLSGIDVANVEIDTIDEGNGGNSSNVETAKSNNTASSREFSVSGGFISFYDNCTTIIVDWPESKSA